MTSNEFLNAAKNAVIKVALEQFSVTVDFNSLQLVWFTHALGYKKCMFFAPELVMYTPESAVYYVEVTYNLAKKEMYVDFYAKKSNTVFEETEIEYLAKR